MRLEAVIDDHLQRRADTEDDEKIECDDCQEGFWHDELFIIHTKYTGDDSLCGDCFDDRHAAAIDAVSEDSRYDY